MVKPQTDFIDKDVNLLRFENNEIDEFLGRKIQRRNSSKHPNFDDVLNKKQKDIIYEIYKKDFIQLGYDK